MSPHGSTIKRFLTKHIPNRDLAIDHDIFAMGFVSSLFAMQLVMFVESEFNIQLDDEDLTIDNFRTIERITGLVEHKLAPPSAS